MRNLIPLPVLLLCCTMLASCGGSSDNNTPEQPPSLLINAGPDIAANEQSVVQLNAQVSDSTASLTYSWNIAPTLDINHPDTNAAAASLTTPVTTLVQSYTLTVTATDESGSRAQDEVVLTVQPVNDAPVALISHNQLPELAERQYPAGFTVQLDGSASQDPDAVAGQDAIASWQWQQTAGNFVLDGVITNQPLLTFNAPVLAEANAVTMALTVTDQEGASHTSEIALTIQSESDSLPQVDAGIDHQVISGESIILNGVASHSVSTAEPLLYQWQIPALPDVVIDQPAQVQTFAVAPAVTTATDLVFVLVVTDQFGNQVEDNLAVRVLPLPIFRMNDTGVMAQSTATAITNQHQGGYPGQDGQRGQDIIHSRGLYEKAGRGDNGFDFTRLNDNGDEVDDISQPWRCVRDNITGLVWERKLEDGLLFDAEHTYTWYFEEDNGGFEGQLSDPVTSCTLANCNTSDYVTQVNTVGLCGFYDWRLPSHQELLSIVHYGISSGAMLDSDYFSSPGSDTPLWYWTRNASADGVAEEMAQNAWAIDFVSGTDNFLNKGSAARIRLVRAGR